ncbi:MAG: hypothetical protein PVSMB8_16880 [Vulcanimicrobiaceae bacterium]
MNTTRLIIAIIVVWIVSFGLGYLIHGMSIQEYAQVPQLYRGMADVKFPFIILANLAFAVGAVWIYAMGVEDKPWVGQGVRFGIAVWLVLPVTWFLIAFATQPVPAVVLYKQLGYELIAKIVLGLVTAGIYRKA